MAEFLSESSDSSSDGEQEELISLISCHLEENASTKTRKKVVHTTDFLSKVVPSWSPLEFRKHFRMLPSTFEFVEQLLTPHVPVKHTELRHELMAAIWILSTPDSYRSVGANFGMGKSSVHYYAMRIFVALAQLSNEFIKFPNQEEYAGIAEQFKNTKNSKGFPGVIGCVDGTFIPINGRGEENNRNAYITRKGFSAMHLQAICDSNLMFLDVVAGYPGSVHDARVFRNSNIKSTLSGDEGEPLDANFHLLGDSAYPLSLYLLSPYRDNGHLSAREKMFNRAHSSIRSVIERAFGLLKGKFRRLKYLEMSRIPDISTVIVAACVLHNIILSKEGLIEEHILPPEERDAHDLQTNYPHGVQNAAVAKRNFIASIL